MDGPKTFALESSKAVKVTSIIEAHPIAVPPAKRNKAGRIIQNVCVACGHDEWQHLMRGAFVVDLEDVACANCYECSTEDYTDDEDDAA